MGSTAPPARRRLTGRTATIAAAAIIGIPLIALNWPASEAATSHTVVYQAEADAAHGSGRTGDITLQTDAGGTAQQAGAKLPLTASYASFHSGDFVYLSVQNQDYAGTVTCRITIDGKVASENTSSGAYTIAACQARVP